MLTADAYVRRSDRRSALEWIIFNTAFGMADGHTGHCTSYCGFASEIGNDYGAVLALDVLLGVPDADLAKLSSVPDPRPTLPTDWFDAGNQHVVLRDRGWATDENTIFSYYCTNTQIDHEHEFCGGFDLYSQGEYITKGRDEFNDYNDEFSLALNKNTLMLLQHPGQTWCRPTPWCSFNQAADDGGQFWHGYQAGLVPLYHSELPSYAAMDTDMTNVYNGGWGDYSKFSGITSASRSLVYLRAAKQLIYYDRGASGADAWAKATYLLTTGPPEFRDRTASWVTRSGKQRVYWTTLRAQTPPRLDATLKDASTANDWEIHSRIKVDGGNVRSARFLSVLQWGPLTFPATAPVPVTSAAGNAFEGTVIGPALVMFMHTWPSTFTSVTYPAMGADTDYVADLKPNTMYSISGAGVASSGKSDSAGVLVFHAAGTGNITVSATSLSNPGR